VAAAAMKESSAPCVVLFFFFALRVAAAAAVAFAALICVGLVLGCLLFRAVIRHEFIGNRRGETGTDVAFAQYDATTTAAAATAVERERIAFDSSLHSFALIEATQATH
jgi:hypothetical protein